MKTNLMKILVALGLVSMLAVGASTASFAAPEYETCYQQYDSSGFPTGPTCPYR